MERIIQNYPWKMLHRKKNCIFILHLPHSSSLHTSRNSSIFTTDNGNTGLTRKAADKTEEVQNYMKEKTGQR